MYVKWWPTGTSSSSPPPPFKSPLHSVPYSGMLLAKNDRRLLTESWREAPPGDSGPRAEYADIGRVFEVWKLGTVSDPANFASSGFVFSICTMSWERSDVSRVRQCSHALSLSKSSRRPGNGAPALMFFRHV